MHTPDKRREAIQRNKLVAIQFLFTELQTGMMFADLASSAEPWEKDKIRSQTANARKAYDSFLRFRNRVQPSEEQARQLDVGFSKLRDALRSLGEQV